MSYCFHPGNRYVSEHDDKGEHQPEPVQGGRNSTFSAEAYPDDEGSMSGSRPSDDPRDVTGGAAVVDPEFDGFRQPTAMFDKGEFLGELAEIVDGVPDTRAQVEAEAFAPKGCRLIIVAGPDLGLEWSFKAKEIIIGRDEDCQLVMSDIAVSRRHARISFENDHFVLTDLSSGNGTFLNGVRVQQERLSPGDEIIIGERTLRFVELNEAPATSAAMPVPQDFQAPEVGEIPPNSGDFEPVLRPSKVEPALADSDEPAVGSAVIPVPDDPPKPSGQALRALFKGFAVVAGVAALAAGGWFLYQRYLSGETPAERQLRAKREFLQGIELVKQLRCGDATIMFRRVVLAEPDHPRAPAYLAHCEVQMAHWAHMVAAREMAAARRYIEAIDRLKQVPADSDYGKQAARDREVYARSIAYALVDEAKDAWGASDIDKALELIDRALELAPDLEEARTLRRQIADASAVPKVRRRRSTKFVVPSYLRHSVGLYRSAKIGAAIDAAEASGGSRARTWAESHEVGEETAGRGGVRASQKGRRGVDADRPRSTHARPKSVGRAGRSLYPTE